MLSSMSRQANRRTHTRKLAETDLERSANTMQHGDGPSLTSVIDLIEKFREETRASIDGLRTTVESFTSRIQAVETSLQDVDDRVQTLESVCTRLSKENKSLMTKLDDLEGRSRRQNLRVIGIPEGLEGAQITKFMEDFFRETVGITASENSPLLDRAHRIPAPKPPASSRPRPMIVRVHHFQIKQRILQLARDKSLLFRGNKVYIFPDFTQEVVKRRMAFADVKKLLRNAAVKYGLLFPARLQVTFQDQRFTFDSPGEAMGFYHEKISPTLTRDEV